MFPYLYFIFLFTSHSNFRGYKLPLILSFTQIFPRSTHPISVSLVFSSVMSNSYLLSHSLCPYLTFSQVPTLILISFYFMSTMIRSHEDSLLSPKFLNFQILLVSTLSSFPFSPSSRVLHSSGFLYV